MASWSLREGPCIVLAHAGGGPALRLASWLAREALAASSLEGRLVEAEGEPPEVPEGCRSLVAIAATGGVERLLLGLASEWRGPLAVLGLPVANSLSSVAEAAPLLRGRALVAALPGVDPRGLRLLAEVLRGVAAAGSLRGERLLLAGGMAPWLVWRGEWLAERLGLEVAEAPPGELVDLMREAPGDWVEAAARRLLEGARGARLPPGEPGRSVRLAWAVGELARRRGAAAVSVNCPSILEEAGGNACLAHFLAEELGVVVGCEGDPVALASLLLASRIQGSPAWQANLAGAWSGRALLAHCAPPRGYARLYWLGPHSITGGSTTVRARLGLDWASLLRLPPGEGLPAVAAEARVASGEPGRPMQCETQLLLELPGHWLLENGTGNHYAVLAGRHGPGLVAAARSLGLELEAWPPGLQALAPDGGVEEGEH